MPAIAQTSTGMVLPQKRRSKHKGMLWKEDRFSRLRPINELCGIGLVLLPDVSWIWVYEARGPGRRPSDQRLGKGSADSPKLCDPKTGEMVDFLFLCRMRQLATNYLNPHLIPRLCRKAGVPQQDLRGRITSHRARSTNRPGKHKLCTHDGTLSEQTACRSHST